MTKSKCLCGCPRPEEKDYKTKEEYQKAISDWKLIHHPHLYGTRINKFER